MAREACPDIPEPLCRMKRDAKHKPQVGGGWHPSFPDGCVRNSVTVSSARQLPVRAALRQNANACAFTLHRFYNLYYTRPGKKSQSAFCISFPARTPRLLWIFPAPRPPGMRTQGGAMLYVIPRSNGDPACWRPAWGGVRLRGNDWWVRVIFGEWCRFAQDDTWGTGAWYQICSVQMLAPSARPHPSLRATFPLEGEGFCGGAMLYVIPLNNGDPACWRPAGGRGSLCGNDWWVRMIFDEWCRFAQDDTVGYRGVIRSLFGMKYSTVKLTDTAFWFSSHSPATLCVILSEAAHRV